MGIRSAERRLFVVFYSLVLLLSFGLMVHDLTGLILWADEAWTINVSDPTHDAGDTIRQVADDVHPPLFFINLYLWRHVAGSSLFAMRYFAVLLILLSTALVVRLGRDLFGPSAGLIAGLLYALHDLIGVFGQEVRHYPQQQLTVGLAIWLYWRLWSRPGWGRALLFSLSGAALLWTYYWGGFILVALGLHALVTRKYRFVVLLLAFAGIAVLFLPWLPALYDQMTQERPEGLPHAISNSWATFTMLIAQVSGTPETLWVLLLAAGVLGALTVHRWRPTAVTILPALIIVITVGGTILINEVYPVLFARSVGVVVPAVAVLAAHTLAQFRRAEQGIVLGFIVWYSLTTTSAAPPLRADWSGVAAYLKQHSGPHDLILLELNNRELKDWEEQTLAYYLQQQPRVLRYLSTEGARVADPARFPGFLAQSLRDEKHLWVVKLGWPYYDLRVDLRQLGFVESAPPLSWEPFAGLPIEIYRFDRLPGRELIATFGDVMRLAEADPVVVGDSVAVNLLWWPSAVPERNYSVSAFVLNESGVLVKQHDSYPMNNRSPTLNWQAEQVYYDSHVLADLPPGRYQVGVKVYYFTDPGFQQLEIAQVAGCEQNCEYWILGTVEIE